MTGTTEPETTRRVVVRHATTDDLALLVSLNAGLFREDAGARDPSVNADWPRSDGERYFTEALEDADAVVLAADNDGVCGYLLGRLKRADAFRTVPTATLESMFVHSERRNGGVGAMLVGSFLHWARDAGAGRIAVTAYAENEGALRFYRRFGLRARTMTLDMALSAS